MAFGQAVDSVQIAKEAKHTAWVERHNPRLASILSAAVPGAGQIYNRKYWKAPIAWAGIGTAIYFIDFNQTRFTTYRNALIAVLDGDSTTLDPFNGQVSTGDIQDAVDTFRRRRDRAYIGLGLVYALNIIDANIDAHFVRFDVGDELSLHCYPSIASPLAQTPSLSIALTFR